MGLIKIYGQDRKKAKKKPGWQKVEEDYQAWLDKHKAPSSTPSSIPKTSASSRSTTKRLASNVVNSRFSQQATLVRERLTQERLSRLKSSLMTAQSALPPKVHDPKVLYKDNPEMLERELIARERKFVTAPAYNKGGDVLVTPELLKDIQAGGTRRRG